jgi:hypothetical protein
VFSWFKKSPSHVQQKHAQEDYLIYKDWFTVICPSEQVSKGLYAVPIYYFQRNGNYFRVHSGWTVITGKYIPPRQGEKQISMIDFVFGELPDKVGQAYYRNLKKRHHMEEASKAFDEEYSRLVDTYTDDSK